MRLIAIHQPNYAPWLGYFHKMARADLFILLDDVQFSKGSYTNRVQIANGGAARWLTVPVRHVFGTPIKGIALARADWMRAHLDTLRASYRHAGHFDEVWPEVSALYTGLPQSSLAQANAALIARIAERMGISTPMQAASSIDVGSAAGDDRLIAICRRIGADVAYLSGRGGTKYQDEAKFAAAGIPLHYTTFEQPRYSQGCVDFVSGLSALDAVFHLGWKGAAALVTP
jgi:WbqC-like protein family